MTEHQNKIINMRRYIRNGDTENVIKSIRSGPEVYVKSTTFVSTEPRLLYTFRMCNFELLEDMIKISSELELHDLACEIATLECGLPFLKMIQHRIGRFQWDALRSVYMYPKDVGSIYKNREAIKIFTDNGSDLAFLFPRCGNPSYIRCIMDMGGDIHSKVFTIIDNKKTILISLSEMIGTCPPKDLNKSISQMMSGLQSEHWDEYCFILRREFWFLLAGSLSFPDKIHIIDNSTCIYGISKLNTDLICNIKSFM